MNLYIATLKRWFLHVVKEPHTVMFISLVFVIFSIPIVTIGLAAAIVLHLSRFSADGRKVAFKAVLGTHVRPVLKKALVMGWGDLFVAFLSVVCIRMVINAETFMVLKLFYILYLLLNFFFLLSAIYRYPMMICNEELALEEIILKGLLATFKNLPVVFLVVMVIITVFILSYFTKVGVVLVFPGAAAILAIHFYKQSLCEEGYDEETGSYKMVRR